MLSMEGPVLLTGATGFVGTALIARYLERTDRRVLALVRADDDEQASVRLRAAVGRVLPDPEVYGDRLVAIAGDVTLPRLGLDRERHDALAAEVSEIVHAAASISFELDLESSRAINVEGTRRMLDLAASAARRGGLRRFSYVSTAYVAGTHRGRFHEADLDVGQEFRNAYEQSKFEAERLVRQHREVLPVQVFRPSIVVGEAATGWTPAFNVIYWPLRAFARGTYTALPARRRSPVDVVSICFVADAIFELTRHRWGAGETYHLAAGDGAATVGEMLDMGAAYFERRRPRAIPPWLYRRAVHPVLLRRSTAARRQLLERSTVYFPYFAMRATYDTSRTAERLAESGIAPAPLGAYFDRLLDYAVAVRWGKAETARFTREHPAAAHAGRRLHQDAA